jgi:hypothetical protein
MVKYKKPALRPIGHLIEKVTGHLLDHPNSKAQKLWRDWRRAVGDHIAKHSEPVRLENGVLHVRVEHSVWMSNLTFMKPQILKTLQKSYQAGAIIDLRFREGSLRSKGKQEPKKPVPPLPPTLPGEERQASKLVAGVDDGDLKAMLSKLYESHLVRQRTDPRYRNR